MAEALKIWKPYRQEVEFYNSQKDAYSKLDGTLQGLSLILNHEQTIKSISDDNLAIIEKFALINLEENINRPSKRVKLYSKEEVLGVLPWPYTENKQRIDQVNPEIEDICSDFYNVCITERNKIVRQIWEHNKYPDTTSNNMSPRLSIGGGLAIGSLIGYQQSDLFAGVTSAIAGMVLITTASIILSRRDYKKKMINDFKLSVEDAKKESLVSLVKTLKKHGDTS